MKRINIIFTVIFMVILYIIPIATFVAEKEDFSVFENRTLADEPKLSVKTVFDGEYFTAAETYLKDHVIARDGMLKIYTATQKYLLFRPSVNGIIDTGDVLLPYIDPKYAQSASDDQIAVQIAEIEKVNKTVSEYGGRFIYVGIPSQATMFADDYPAYLSDISSYNINTAKKFAKELAKIGVEFINAGDFLTKELYFKTDHHFNIEGGYRVYEAICDSAGIDAVPWEEFVIKDYEQPIYGSRNRKIYKLTSLSDKISFYEADLDIPFERYDDQIKVESNVFRFPSDEAVPSYEIYMGGDVAETVITTNRPELPSILIYGDSYTNAPECFAYLSFNETRSLDLRHYWQMSLREYVEKYKPDFVVCIRDDGSYVTSEGNGKLN